MITQSLHTKASRAGLELVDLGDRVEARLGTYVKAFHADPKRALALALARIEEDKIKRAKKAGVVAEPAVFVPVTELVVSPEVEIVVDEKKGIIKGSIIKSKYKIRYKANGDYSCGDELSGELRAYIAVTVKGRIVVDLVKLKKVAVDNNVWKDRYEHLNAGQMRMTVGNCLRAKMVDGDAIDIGGAIFDNNEPNPNRAK